MNNIFTELKRRNIFRVAGVYVVVSWLIMQVISVMTPALLLPDWVDSFFALLLVVGFPIALIVAWAFELTPEGMKRTEAVPKGESVRDETGKKLNVAILAGLVAVAGLLVWQTVSQPKPTGQSAGGNPQTTADAPVQVSSSTSIAVLPFADMSASGDQEYFSDGMAEEILNALVKVPKLRVAGRTSSFSFKGKDSTIQEIGAALNVLHVLEGSVRKQGDAVRITAQLIKAEDGIHLWSETYDGTLENIFDLQEEISRAIAGELKVLLNVDDNVRIAEKLTDSTEAYDLYLKGNEKKYQFWVEGAFAEAIELFERAVEIDPEFVEAWHSLARAHSGYSIYATADDEAHLDAARRATYRVLAVNPNYLPAKTQLLINDWQRGNLAETTDTFYKSEKKLSGDEHYVFYRAYSAAAFGQTTAAIPYFKKSLELEPLRSDTIWNIGQMYYLRGDFEAAQPYLNHAKELGFGAVAITEASMKFAEGDPQGAIETFMGGYDEWGEQYASEVRDPKLWRLYAQARWGGDDEAKGQIKNFILALLNQPNAKVNQTILGTLIGVGEIDLFFANYQNNVFAGNLQVLNNLWDPFDTHQKALRQHPDFPTFAERIGLLHIWQNHGWPDLCKPNPGTDGSDGQFTCK